MDHHAHFLKVLGQVGLLILIALIGCNAAGAFLALVMGAGQHAVTFLCGWAAAMAAALATWIMAQAALVSASQRLYTALFWAQIAASATAALIFAIGVMDMASAGGAA